MPHDILSLTDKRCNKGNMITVMVHTLFLRFEFSCSHDQNEKKNLGTLNVGNPQYKKKSTPPLFQNSGYAPGAKHPAAKLATEVRKSRVGLCDC